MRRSVAALSLLSLLGAPLSTLAQPPSPEALDAGGPAPCAQPVSAATPVDEPEPASEVPGGASWQGAPAEGELRLLVTGDSGGFSSWHTEITGPLELIPYFRTRPGKVIPEATETSVYQHGARILFRETPWSVKDLRTLLGGGELRLETVCERLPVLHNERELSLQVDTPGCLSGPRRFALDALMHALGGPRPAPGGGARAPAPPPPPPAPPSGPRGRVRGQKPRRPTLRRGPCASPGRTLACAGWWAVRGRRPSSLTCPAPRRLTIRCPRTPTCGSTASWCARACASATAGSAC